MVAKALVLIAVALLGPAQAREQQGVAMPDVPHTFHERFPLKRVAKVGLPGGEVTAMDAGQYFVYVATNEQILKINRRTLMVEKAFPLAPHYKDVTAMKIDHPDVFVAASSTSSEHALVLLKISKGLELEKVYQYPENDNVPYSMEIDDEYIYTGQYTFPGKVVKISKSSLSVVGELTMLAGEDDVRQLESDPTDPDDKFLYANTNTEPGRIIKVQKDTMQVVQSLTLPKGADRPLAGIELDPEHLYVATNTVPGRVIKIQKDTLSVVTTTTLHAGEDQISGLESDRQFLFASCYTSPGTVVRIRKSDMKRVQAITLQPGENKLTTIVSGLHHLYVGTFTNPAQVIQLEGFEHQVDCEVGPWGGWGKPTQSCDGKQGRTRPIIQLPQFGGKACGGTLVDCKYADECTSGGGKEVIEYQDYSADWCKLRDSCTGGMVFNEHASACPRTCANTNPKWNNEQKPRCQCPADKPLEFDQDGRTVCTSAQWCPQAHMVPCSHVRCQMHGDRSLNRHHVSVRHHGWREENGEKHYCRHLGDKIGCQCMCFKNELQAPATP